MDDILAEPPHEPLSDPWAFLRRTTSARVALGRTGDSLPTARVLEFALAHARARDAVHRPLDVPALAAALTDFSPITVESRAQNHTIYLQRPDFGRRLSDASRAVLPRGSYDAVMVLADGLSAAAVQSQGAELCRRLMQAGDLRFAAPIIASRARVALGDEIAHALGAAFAVVLIGERPGLSATDSLGAYITFAAKPGVTRDADRNCVSNIRPGGLALEDAAQRISAIMALARALQRTGTQLKEDAALTPAAPDNVR